MSGQGVALGRSPLIDHAVTRGDLVTPFSKRYDSPRGYFALSGSQPSGRPEVQQFIAWLRAEAAEGADVAAATVSGEAKVGSLTGPPPAAGSMSSAPGCR
jgi:LysR family transcriptional regulator, glycine cleavage system transcriptional activator